MSIRPLCCLLLTALVWAEPGRLKVLSWNVHGGREGVPRVVEVLRASSAELFLLQEAPPLLEVGFPGWTAVRGGNHGELLILGRGLSGRRVVRLGRGRPCLVAQWKGIMLVNVHYSTAVGNRSLSTSGKQVGQYLLHTAAIRREQTDALLALIGTTPNPVLVAGDFNSTPKMEPPTRLAAVLRRIDTGPTFPAAHPAGAIDHFFLSWQLQVGPARVIPTTASDHLPMLVTLEAAPSR